MKNNSWRNACLEVLEEPEIRQNISKEILLKLKRRGFLTDEDIENFEEI